MPCCTTKRRWWQAAGGRWRQAVLPAVAGGVRRRRGVGWGAVRACLVLNLRRSFSWRSLNALYLRPAKQITH